MVRSDHLAHVPSWEIADQTQDHTSLMSAQARPVYSASAIGLRLERIEHEELRWRAFFEEKAIEPLILWYDDLIAEPAAVVQKVAQFVGEDLAPTSDMPQRPNPLSGMAVQRNEINQSWQRRFRMERNVGLRKPLWKLVHRRRLQKSNDRL